MAVVVLSVFSESGGIPSGFPAFPFFSIGRAFRTSLHMHSLVFTFSFESEVEYFGWRGGGGGGGGVNRGLFRGS